MNSSRTIPLIGVLVSALALAGCSEKAIGGTSSAANATVVDDAVGTSFSGGTPGTATGGKTIKIGLINQEGGTVSNPEVSSAIQAAFSYLNKKQNGIKGASLKLEVCKIGSSEEEAQQCAQRFLNDPSISVIMQGGLNVGSQAVHQTIDGKKPTLVTLANPGPDATAANTYALNPSALASLPGAAAFAKSKGYKSIAVVSSNDPGDRQISQIGKQMFEAAGVKADVITFPYGSTDLTPTFTSAVIENPDAIAPIVVTTSACIATANSLQQIGSDIPVIGSSLCSTEDVRKALGDFPKWAYESTTLSLYADDPTGQVGFYKAVMADYAPRAELGIGAPAAFGAAFVLAKVLNRIGPDAITADSVSKGLSAYTDGVLLGTPKVDFGSVPDNPALSGMADRFYTYDGAGKWTAGDWQNVSH